MISYLRNLIVSRKIELAFLTIQNNLWQKCKIIKQSNETRIKVLKSRVYASIKYELQPSIKKSCLNFVQLNKALPNRAIKSGYIHVYIYLFLPSFINNSMRFYLQIKDITISGVRMISLFRLLDIPVESGIYEPIHMDKKT